MNINTSASHASKTLVSAKQTVTARETPATPLDSVQIGQPPSEPGLGRSLARSAGRAMLATLPAVGTCAGLLLGGPNAAGACLVGGIIGGGVAAIASLGGELNMRDAFGVGGWVGLLSGAAGMLGPAGVGVMLAGSLTRQAIGQTLSYAEYGQPMP